jgi:hypothetical protein
MTTRNDYIRQASIFTMCGLIDPRFSNEQALVPVQRKKYNGNGSLKFLYRALKAVAIFFEGKPLVR